MRPIIVLGTGTAVGKTYVTVALSHALQTLHPNRPLLALKPVETGFPPHSNPPSPSPPPGTDAHRLAQASTYAPPRRPHPLYAFPDPVSPHLAARRAATPLDLSAIHTWATDDLPYTALLVIETAGGTFTPLSATTTNLDLALVFEPALWILTAPDSLGVLHDVTATLAAMTARARPPDHIVLTSARLPDASTGTNAAELRALHGTDPVVLPLDDPSPLYRLALLLQV